MKGGLAMIFSENNSLPPMKYTRKQEVSFTFQGAVLHGVIEVADFGGSFANDCHSYDIYVANHNTLYKHVPEADVFLQKD